MKGTFNYAGLGIGLRRHWIILSAVMSCLATTMSFAKPSAKADHAEDPLVELSPYEVRARGIEFERWIKVSSPNFIVYTDAGLSDAKRVLRQSEMLHRAVRHYFHREPMVRAPMILVLPVARSDWRNTGPAWTGGGTNQGMVPQGASN